MQRIADYAQGRDNNFNLLRLIAASMVIYAHAHTVGQGFANGVPDWSGDVLFDLTGMDSGRIAVQVFFIISGFLVAQSLTRSGSVREFFYARVLRLMPALLTAIVLMVFVIGILFTTVSLHDYLLSGEVKRFLWYNATLRNDPEGQFLPGVFEGNIYRRVINGSLWTLPWEAKMYLSLGALGLLGLMRRRRVIAIAFGIVFVLFCLSREKLLPEIKYLPLTAAFTSFFYLGVVAWLYRERIPMGPVSGLAAATLLVLALFLFKGFVIARWIYPVLLAYTALSFAFVPRGAIRGFNRIGDYSYGIYVYGFPLQQSLMAINPAFTPAQVCIYGWALALLLAIPSWHLIEKPMLALKPRRRPPAVPDSATKLETATLRT